MGLPRPYSPPTVDVPHIGGVLILKMGREASVNRRKNRKGPFQIMESIDSGRPQAARDPSEWCGHCVGRRGAASRRQSKNHLAIEQLVCGRAIAVLLDDAKSLA